MELRELRRLSAENELSLNYIYKDLMISKALLALQDNDKLILKGGTAINRIYLKDKKRFSEDIDLDFIFDGAIKQAIPVLKEIVKKQKEFTIERPRQMHETIRFDAYYTNALETRDRIMLEFHILKKKHGNYNKSVVNYGFVPFDSALLNTYDIDALFRQKIECLRDRLKGKDIYDTYYLSDISDKKISQKEYREISAKLTLDIRKIKAIANSTNHYIKRALRPDWPVFIEELKQKIREKSLS